MLCNDLYTYQRKSDYEGGSPHCRLCQASSENLQHILTICSAYNEIRSRIVEDMQQIVEHSDIGVNFKEIRNTPKHLTQFILDCTSLNLPYRYRPDDENTTRIFNLSRDLCFHIKKKRAQKLKIIST